MNGKVSPSLLEAIIDGYKLCEAVGCDVNGITPQTVPGACINGINKNEYFPDKPEEMIDLKFAPNAGRTSLGMGITSEQRVCADAGAAPSGT